MSYIRSGSNPEGLYIFGSRDGVEIYGPIKGKVLPFAQIPSDVWGEFCQGFVDEFYPDEFEHRGLSVTGEWVDDADGNNFKMVLRYEDWELAMWDVTWAYIIHRYEPPMRNRYYLKLMGRSTVKRICDKLRKRFNIPRRGNE